MGITRLGMVEWCSICVCTVAIVVVKYYICFLVGFIHRKENIRKAKERGHVIQADLVSESRTGIDNTKNDVVATYQYKWDGKTYIKHSASCTYGAPAHETLYFDKDPALASWEKTYMGRDFNLRKNFLVVFIIMVLIYSLAV